MAIKIQELRYLRRTPGEIAVLRELVSFQRCRRICPSEFWLAQMTRLSERSVRRVLVKLVESGFISFGRHRQDFRGPCRPTNSYTLHPNRIQEAIGAGKVAVAKALGAYYKRYGAPLHSRRLQVRLTGGTSGRIGPQDVSLSREQRQDEKEVNTERGSNNGRSVLAHKDGPNYSNKIEAVELNPCQEDFHTCKEKTGLSTQIVPIPTPPPISAPPPSPPLTLTACGQQQPKPMTADEAFSKAPKMAPHPREDNLDTRLEWWRADCQKYGVNELLEAFEYFLKTYPQVAYGRPITTFLMAGSNGRLVYEVRQRKAGTSNSARTPGGTGNKDASPAEIHQ